jgi:hypothetical protein
MLVASTSFAGDTVFAELEEIYVTVLADSISADHAPDRVYAVAMGRTGMSDVKYIPMPDALWTKLAARLKAKGIDPSQFVSLTEIGWKDGNKLKGLVHKPTGKRAWVYSISGITWHGDNRLHVAQDVYHGGEAAGGCTVVLEKKEGKWVIVERTDSWIS